MVARHALPTPRTSHEVFERLEQAGHLPADTAERMGPIIGFRNRVVHLYDKIDEHRLYEILTLHWLVYLDSTGSSSSSRGPARRT